MIEVKDVKFKYQDDEKYALNGINIKFEKGKFIAILGHNGSGKSTLAKLINGLLIPNEGSIHVDDMDTKDDSKIWDIRSRAGLVFQNPDNQIVATIVEEDVAFGPENLGIPQKELRERVDRALLSVGMEKYKKSAPHLLSGGQKQRVAIAGILAMEPDYVILDEPTAMLDPSGRKEVIDTLLKLKSEGKGVILITHNMEEAALAEELIVMEEGNIILQGKPLDVFSNVEKIKNIGLDVPVATEISYNLKKSGHDIKIVLNDQELVEEIWKLSK